MFTGSLLWSPCARHTSYGKVIGRLCELQRRAGGFGLVFLCGCLGHSILLIGTEGEPEGSDWLVLLYPMFQNCKRTSGTPFLASFQWSDIPATAVGMRNRKRKMNEEMSGTWDLLAECLSLWVWEARSRRSPDYHKGQKSTFASSQKCVEYYTVGRARETAANGTDCVPARVALVL